MPRKKRAQPVLSQAGSAAVYGSLEPSLQHGADDFLESTTMGLSGMSRDEVQNISHFMDSSLEMPSMFSAGATESVDEWQVQSVEAIIQDVKQRVHERKPWRKELDDEVLERRRQNERQGRLDRGYHIILPDNRVRAMEDQLSRRVRAELLGEEVPVETATAVPPANTRRAEASKAKAVRKGGNPWYLPSKSWYSKSATKDGESQGLGFPYDSQILKTDGLYATACDNDLVVAKVVDGDGDARPLTQRDKETLQIVDDYRAYMKGGAHASERLPHWAIDASRQGH